MKKKGNKFSGQTKVKVCCWTDQNVNIVDEIVFQVFKTLMLANKCTNNTYNVRS